MSGSSNEFRERMVIKNENSEQSLEKFCQEAEAGAIILDMQGIEVTVESLREMFLQKYKKDKNGIFRLDKDYVSIGIAIDKVMERRGKKLEDYISDFIEKARMYRRDFKISQETLVQMFIEDGYSDEEGPLRLLIDKEYINKASFIVANEGKKIEDQR